MKISIPLFVFMLSLSIFSEHTSAGLFDNSKPEKNENKVEELKNPGTIKSFLKSIKKGNIEELKIHLKKNPSLLKHENLKMGDFREGYIKETVSEVALRYHQIDVVKYFVEIGVANPKTKIYYHCGVFTSCHHSNLLQEAILKADVPKIEELLHFISPSACSYRVDTYSYDTFNSFELAIDKNKKKTFPTLIRYARGKDLEIFRQWALRENDLDLLELIKERKEELDASCNEKANVIAENKKVIDIIAVTQEVVKNHVMDQFLKERNDFLERQSKELEKQIKFHKEQNIELNKQIEMLMEIVKKENQIK